MSKNYVQIDPKDNIIVAITSLEKGTVASVAGTEVILKEDIKQKHKFSLRDFNVGDEIFMYGVLIGKALLPISQGCAITIENVKHADELIKSQQSNAPYYDKHLKNAKNLMLDKNHDYGEAWRDMRIGSYTDLILMKINRIKQIEGNSGKTLISEGNDSHYTDIINYAVFALIKLSES